MKKMTVIFIAVAALVGLFETAHAQTVPSTGSHWELRKDGSGWESQSNNTSQNHSAEHAVQNEREARIEEACNPEPPRGLEVYPVTVEHGCTVWCRVGMATSWNNPPPCNRDAEYSTGGVYVSGPVFCPSYRTYSWFGVYTRGCPGYGGTPYFGGYPYYGGGVLLNFHLGNDHPHYNSGFGHGWHR